MFAGELTYRGFGNPTEIIKAQNDFWNTDTPKNAQDVIAYLDCYRRSLSPFVGSEHVATQGQYEHISMWSEIIKKVPPQKELAQLFCDATQVFLCRAGLLAWQRETSEEFARRVDQVSPLVLREYYDSLIRKCIECIEDEKPNPLGKGNFGAVYRLGNSGSVLKIFSSEESDPLYQLETMMREIAYSPSGNIIGAGLCVFPGVNERQAYTIMPQYGADIYTLQKSFRYLPPTILLDEIIKIVEVCSEYSHARGILHGDIKPENIVQEKQDYALIDFGLAKKNDLKGSPYYVSNVNLGYLGPTPTSPLNYELTAQYDVFCMGVTILELVLCRLMDQDLLRVLHEKGEWYRWDLPISFRDVLLKATKSDPEERYRDLPEMLAALKAVRKEWSRNRRRSPVRWSNAYHSATL